jgi:hypothetical protein
MTITNRGTKSMALIPVAMSESIRARALIPGAFLSSGSVLLLLKIPFHRLVDPGSTTRPVKIDLRVQK